MLTILHYVLFYMANTTAGPKRVARIAAGLASLAGTYGSLSLMGAFGPVSCWTSSGSNTDGTTRSCESGIDYLLGSPTGNAPVLFFWAVVLLALVTFGGAAAWTGHRYITWATTVIGMGISILGVTSIGWYFLLPTLFLLVAAMACSISARRENNGDQPASVMD